MFDITRDEFSKIMRETDTIDYIFDAVDYFGPLFETESYIFHNENGGDFSIIDKYELDKTPHVINWYKLYHIGRSLNIYGYGSLKEFKESLSTIREELKEKLEKNESYMKDRYYFIPNKKFDNKAIIKDKPDVTSLYPKIILNSLYGVQGIPKDIVAFNDLVNKITKDLVEKENKHD